MPSYITESALRAELDNEREPTEEEYNAFIEVRDRCYKQRQLRLAAYYLGRGLPALALDAIARASE